MREAHSRNKGKEGRMAVELRRQIETKTKQIQVEKWGEQDAWSKTKKDNSNEMKEWELNQEEGEQRRKSIKDETYLSTRRRKSGTGVSTARRKGKNRDEQSQQK